MDTPPVIAASFEIPYRRFLDPDGRLVAPLPEPLDDPLHLIAMYRDMVLTRAFDKKAIALQRTGRLGTYASSLGEEAIAVGVGAAMRDDDVFLPSFREHGAQLLRGVSMVELFLFWGGDERGCAFEKAREDFPVSVPVASHTLHTVGVALALKLRKHPRAALCVVGDGGTSKGDFYEAINTAGAWAVPAVFVVANNQWAISVPRAAQTAAKTLAQKAVAAGIEGVQVDGNDVVAVCDAVGQALEKARSGGGPTVVEALTYRLSDHTTADDASRYRDTRLVSDQWRAEPMVRLRAYLTEAGHWTKADEERLLSECDAEVDRAEEEYLAIAPQPPESMFDYLYARMPKDIADQRAAFLAEADGDGGAANG